MKNKIKRNIKIDEEKAFRMIIKRLKHNINNINKEYLDGNKQGSF